MGRKSLTKAEAEAYRKLAEVAAELEQAQAEAERDRQRERDSSKLDRDDRKRGGKQ